MLQVDLETHLNTFHLSLSFSAEPGKTTVLLGESGSGKTTVLRLLAGLLNPQHGRISLGETLYFDSEKRVAVPPQERAFGYVFQDYVLFPHLSVFENIAFGLHAQRLPRQLIRQRVGAVLEQVHLSGFDQRRPAQLSGGQQQRVAIARALALQPALLLLDEPLSALDVQTRREVRHELHRILAEVGITTILVTHQYLEALVFGEQILVLDAGKVIQRGEQRDLLTHPRSSYIAELIGVNFFRGHIVRQETNMLYAIQLQNGAQSFEIVAALKEHMSTEKNPAVGEDAYIIVDPRSITLYPNPPDSSARNVFRGEIVQMLHLGGSPLHSSGENEHVRVSILLNGNMPPLTAEITEASALRMQLHDGKIIYASFKATEASIYT